MQPRERLLFAHALARLGRGRRAKTWPFAGRSGLRCHRYRFDMCGTGQTATRLGGNWKAGSATRVYGRALVNTPLDPESPPAKYSVFTLILGCVFLGILITGGTVMTTRILMYLSSLW